MTTETTATPVTATLIRGRYYDLKGQVWTREKPESLTQEVTPEDEAHLRLHAVEVTYVEGQEYRRPKFEFSNDAANATKFAPVTSRPARRRVAA